GLGGGLGLMRVVARVGQPLVRARAWGSHALLSILGRIASRGGRGGGVGPQPSVILAYPSESRVCSSWASRSSTSAISRMTIQPSPYGSVLTRSGEASRVPLVSADRRSAR